MVAEPSKPIREPQAGTLDLSSEVGSVGFIRRFVQHRAGVAGVVIMLALTVLAALAPVVAPYDPIGADIRVAGHGPSPAHWLGTDALGRDILSRLLFGARISLSVGALSVAVGLCVGGLIGVISGYRGGRFDLLTQRGIDTMQAFPGILLVLLISGAVGPSLVGTIVALALLSIPEFARLARGSVLQVKSRAYIEAARSIGCRPASIVRRHILPNILSPLIVQVSLQFAFTVLILAGLGFLGLGPPPPTPEWGQMLSSGRSSMRTSPHMLLFPAMAISITILALNLIGDALRDALDPRARSGIRQ